MQEKVLKNRKNGLAVLLLTLLLYAAAIVGFVFGCIFIESSATAGAIALLVVCSIWLLIGWIPFLGLRILKPQEALVLTLFGKYIGTIKNEGFYFVNPFCTSINPAAKTRLNQSGDVNGAGSGSKPFVIASTPTGNIELTNKKISLKIMTLNNSRQKINDCLGIPVGVGIVEVSGDVQID